MSNILCTGGAGFIGSHIVDALLKNNHTVVVIDNLSTGDVNNVNGSTFIKCDINDSLNYLFDQYKFDYVFHLAAQINLRHSIKEPYNDAQTNIMGSLNILENCVRTKVKKIIFSSTGGAIYSSQANLPFTENTPAKPESPYGLSKQTIENYMEFYHKVHSFPTTILRYSNVYGPRQNSKGEAGVISIFIEKAIKNEDLTIFGDGQQTRDFIYVNDIVSANLLALDREMLGIFNVSSNYQYSINEIAHKILQLTNSKSKIKHTDSIAGEMLHTRLSSDKLKRHGWNLTCDIENGIKSTIDHFKKVYEIV